LFNETGGKDMADNLIGAALAGQQGGVSTEQGTGLQG